MIYRCIIFILIVLYTSCDKPKLEYPFQQIGYMEFHLEPEEYNKNGCSNTCKIVSFYSIDSAFNSFFVKGEEFQTINIKTKAGKYSQISNNDQQKIIDVANELKKLKEVYFDINPSQETKLYCGPSRLFFIQYDDTLKVIPVAHFNYDKAWDLYTSNLKIIDIKNNGEKRVFSDTILSKKVSIKACELMKHGIAKIVDDTNFFVPLIKYNKKRIWNKDLN